MSFTFGKHVVQFSVGVENPVKIFTFGLGIPLTFEASTVHRETTDTIHC